MRRSGRSGIYAELRRIGKAAAGVLMGTPGAAEAEVDDRPPLPQITVAFDREADLRCLTA